MISSLLKFVVVTLDWRYLGRRLDRGLALVNDDTIEYQNTFVYSVLCSAGEMFSVKVRSQDCREGRFSLLNLPAKRASKLEQRQKCLSLIKCLLAAAQFAYKRCCGSDLPSRDAS